MQCDMCIMYCDVCVYVSLPPYAWRRVYDTQPGVVVFQSAWINRVLTEHCTVYDIPLGQYLVLPHFLVQVYMYMYNTISIICGMVYSM